MGWLFRGLTGGAIDLGVVLSLRQFHIQQTKLSPKKLKWSPGDKSCLQINVIKINLSLKTQNFHIINVILNVLWPFSIKIQQNYAIF